MLIVSEIAEAVEAHRENRMAEAGAARHIVLKMAEMDMATFPEYFRSLVKDTVQDELADAIIRLLDLSAYMGIDIDAHIQAKLAYNATRGTRHGKAY
jgi:NTP pyrophosphatase (non-canonical NTP hydrolase)